MEKKPYGFIYITTNLINGKRYIGQKKIDGKHRTYLGSGAYFVKAVKKYGRENFKRVIVDFADSPEELNQKEQNLISFFNAHNSDDYYNIELGGNKYPLSEHTKELIKKNHADLSGDKSPCYGKRMSEETKRKVSEGRKGIVAYNKGVPMSEEQKLKLKEAWKKRKVRVSNHREIICVETNEKFCSIAEASRVIGIKACSIQAVLCKKRNSVYGKHFVYADEGKVV